MKRHGILFCSIAGKKFSPRAGGAARGTGVGTGRTSGITGRHGRCRSYSTGPVRLRRPHRDAGTGRHSGAQWRPWAGHGSKCRWWRRRSAPTRTIYAWRPDIIVYAPVYATGVEGSIQSDARAQSGRDCNSRYASQYGASTSEDNVIFRFHIVERYFLKNKHEESRVHTSIRIFNSGYHRNAFISASG